MTMSSRRGVLIALALSPFAGVGLAYLLDALGVEPAYVWNGPAWAVAVAIAFLAAAPRRPWRALLVGMAAGVLAIAGTWIYIIIAIINCDGCLS
jgi:hypothetical protein